MSIPVFILHQKRLIASCLAKGFSNEKNITLIGYAVCLEQIDKVPEKTFFIVDEKLLSKSSYLLAEKICKQFHSPKIIVLGENCENPGALRAKNISSFIFLDQSLQEIKSIILKINIIDDCYFEHLHAFKSNFSKIVDVLSPQEKQVINLLLEGKINKDIAKELNISRTTVSSYFARVRQKVEDALDLEYSLDNRTLIHKLIDLRQEAPNL